VIYGSLNRFQVAGRKTTIHRVLHSSLGMLHGFSCCEQQLGVNMGSGYPCCRRAKGVKSVALLSVSCIALVAASAGGAWAQTPQQPETQSQVPSVAPPASEEQAPASRPEATPSPSTTPTPAPTQEAPASQPGEAPLPPVTIYPPRVKPQPPVVQSREAQSAPAPVSPPRPKARAKGSSAGRAPIGTAPVSASTVANAIAAAWPASQTQGAKTGTSGVYTNSTSAATKINTPIVNIPQSLSVVTKEFIADNAFQNLTDVTRYVPGVAIAQGEGNRDELIIRGVDSSANFFVNGFRDDVQIFRDFYNAQSIEILKGPSAITFGRSSGGGLLNRTLKEADGQSIYEATVQTGSWADQRYTIDAGQAVNENFAARLNMMYEKSDGFRQYFFLERYGINPTFTYKVDPMTTLRFSYEYFHDNRTADRGNPSQATMPTGSTKQNPGFPFAPNNDLQAFYGSPTLNLALANVHTWQGFVDHDFGNGMTVKNGTYFAEYDKFYQNVYPGNGPLSGAVNPTDTSFNRAAYQHTTNRNNFFNDTDFFYKAFTGPLYHSIAFGTEFGRQAGIDHRNTGIFPNGTATEADNPFSPGYFGPIDFIHQVPGFLMPGVTGPDSNSLYNLVIESAYARDTIDITPWLQVIGAGRFDRFDEHATDLNVGNTQALDNSFLSPQAAVILKPQANMSIWGAYMVSYLPASGDQFSAITPGTAILKPQKFVNEEVGFKWNIGPRLLYTMSVYNLDRTNVPLPDPNNPGFFILSGSNRIQGFESELKGYVTDAWQSWLGYAYTDARVTSATSAIILPGNRVQLVPYNQFSWWNKYQINPVWAASLGVIYFSDSFASSDDTVVLPGFWRFDAGLFATIDEHWKAQINVENLFNKGYWATADANNNISPGQGRTIRAKLTVRF
jgi:catecholate siderophore receptor